MSEKYEFLGATRLRKVDKKSGRDIYEIEHDDVLSGEPKRFIGYATGVFRKGNELHIIFSMKKNREDS